MTILLAAAGALGSYLFYCWMDRVRPIERRRKPRQKSVRGHTLEETQARDAYRQEENTYWNNQNSNRSWNAFFAIMWNPFR